ncbi:MAG: DUF1217 domain-containing protein [Spiribacter salinus]|uniref:DUF1217 domain-containing protein n=1 Tax=Spiribacter salinus TaxID=1335746 RepID=A0A540VVQ8_9GAMM|nr:MAG: DUF1217 domain-containing protein [Spiribacter salinus]
MSFQPIIPGSGLAGWSFLQSTLARQFEAFEESAPVQRATDYFVENIGAVSSASDLVQDRRLLEVALGAFGLGEDINNKYFIEKVLSEGTIAEDALANKLTDSRYKEMAQAFAFDTLSPTGQTSFAQEIIEKYERRSFEVAVGEQNETFRLGLNLERELPEIASSRDANDTKWLRILGNPALRAVFETAFGLPSQFGQVDLDQQLGVFKENAERRFGTDEISDFGSPDRLEELTQLYFLQDQIKASSGLDAGSVALTLLQSAGQTQL